MRKKIHNQKGKATANPLTVGERVFLRNHKVRGRNKIQDKYESQVYKIVERRENNTYVIQRADGQGTDKVVSQAALQVCPKPMLENHEPNRKAHRQRRRFPVPVQSSEEESDIEEVTLAFQPAEKHPALDGLNDGDSPSEDREPPLIRCSTRATAGKHSNLYNLPRSASRQ